jgi:hypothetical protein
MTRAWAHTWRRFTDEADQQRALIEMHGLYCLSRPSTSIVSVITRAVLLTFYLSAHLPRHG